MPRLTIFAKGNADVRDSLHMLTEDGEVRWNGINAVLRDRPGGWHARVIHETMTRSDALLALPADPPAALLAAALPLGAYPVRSQFETRLFAGGHDAVILSIQPDVMNRLAQSREDGALFYPHDAPAWPPEERRWLAAQHIALPTLPPERSMANLAGIVARIRAVADVPVLVFNLSPVMPWERVHSYRGIAETLGERIRAFNLALVGLSRAIGIAIVDVEAVVARGGATRLKRDAVTLSAEGCRAVAEEVVRVLADLGCLGHTAAAA